MTSGDELRTLMRRFPAPVAVLTLDAGDGQQFGITLGSVVSLSLDPPLVGVSLGRNTPAHELVRTAGAFALSLLAGDQERLAQHFARSGVPPLALWHDVELRDDSEGPPLLADALGWLRCRVDAETEVGDHTFFVGAVEWLEAGRDGAALVYVRQGYVPV